MYVNVELYSTAIKPTTKEIKNNNNKTPLSASQGYHMRALSRNEVKFQKCHSGIYRKRKFRIKMQSVVHPIKIVPGIS